MYILEPLVDGSKSLLFHFAVQLLGKSARDPGSTISSMDVPLLLGFMEWKTPSAVSQLRDPLSVGFSHLGGPHFIVALFGLSPSISLAKLGCHVTTFSITASFSASSGRQTRASVAQGHGPLLCHLVFSFLALPGLLPLILAFRMR